MQWFVVCVLWGCIVVQGEYHQPVLPAQPLITPPNYTKEALFEAHNLLPSDLELTTFAHGNVSRFTYLHEVQGPLTFIIRSCTSSINVTISHVPQNDTGYLSNHVREGGGSMAMSRGMKHVFNWSQTPAGLYLLDLVAEHGATAVTMYAGRLAMPPPYLRIRQNPRVRITPRLHRNRITVRWNQSEVDPNQMHYHMVVNSRRNFSSICEAHMELEMNVTVFSSYQYSQGKARGALLGMNDVFITSVGTSLSFTISNLQRGREYFFNIFAEHNATKINFLYASKALLYDSKIKPVALKDNKPVTVNIRRLGGRALFRYKVSSTLNEAATLSWHVMPCGARVQAEVTSRRLVVVPRQTVEGYAHLQVLSPKPGQRYNLLVYVTSPEQMRQILGVEVLATMKASLLPELPSKPTVYEYESLRRCDSVTIGWLPAPGQSVRYCVSASPVSFYETHGHFSPYPNQCNLDSRLSSQLDFVTKQCHDFSANDNRLVLVETVSNLQPKKDYLIQVTVKKLKGKALSYNLLRVRTSMFDC